MLFTLLFLSLRDCWLDTFSVSSTREPLYRIVCAPLTFIGNFPAMTGDKDLDDMLLFHFNSNMILVCMLATAQLGFSSIKLKIGHFSWRWIYSMCCLKRCVVNLLQNQTKMHFLVKMHVDADCWNKLAKCVWWSEEMWN